MNYLLWVSFFSLFILGFGDNIRGPLFPEIIQTFNLSDSRAAWYFALSSFMSFIGSFMVRKIKTISHLLLILYAGVLCIFLSFVIQYWASSYDVVLFGVLFFGVSVGLLGVAQNNLVILGTSPKNRSRMLSYLHSMYGVASLLAPLFVAWLSDQKWQQIILHFAWVALIFGIIGLIYNSRQKDSILHFSQFQEPVTSRLEGVSELKISVVISLYVLAEIMMGTRLAQFMRKYYNYDLSESSLYVTLLFVFVLLGRILISFTPHHYNIRKQLLFSLIASVVLILFGLFVHPLALVLSGFSLAPFYPLSMSYISQLFPTKSTTIVSWTLSIQGFCIVLMHLGVGQMADYVGLKFAMVFAPIFLLGSFIILLSMKDAKSA
ncbi:MAG: MFS transporter [Bdellovibrionaceae bacterium]|nr:MFS transporter [Pseudobdellovibrionaceae bacterium]